MSSFDYGNNFQFQINLFNKVIQINMNYNFLCEFGNIIDLDTKNKKFDYFLDCIDDVLEFAKFNSTEDFTILQFQDTFQINLKSNYAKDISEHIGNVLSNIRTGVITISDSVPVNVIFAFVKKLEIAAFNHFRELNNSTNRKPARISYGRTRT